MTWRPYLPEPQPAFKWDPNDPEPVPLAVLRDTRDLCARFRTPHPAGITARASDAAEDTEHRSRRAGDTRAVHRCGTGEPAAGRRRDSCNACTSPSFGVRQRSRPLVMRPGETR